jgi:hypothetical protein
MRPLGSWNCSPERFAGRVPRLPLASLQYLDDLAGVSATVVGLGCAVACAFARLARWVSGNPFRPVTVDPACLTPTVLALAQAAYDEPEMPACELETQAG